MDEAMVHGVDEKCAHGVKLSAYLASAVWDVVLTTVPQTAAVRTDRT